MFVAKEFLPLPLRVFDDQPRIIYKYQPRHGRTGEIGSY